MTDPWWGWTVLFFRLDKRRCTQFARSIERSAGVEVLEVFGPLEQLHLFLHRREVEALAVALGTWKHRTQAPGWLESLHEALDIPDFRQDNSPIRRPWLTGAHLSELRQGVPGRSVKSLNWDPVLRPLSEQEASRITSVAHKMQIETLTLDPLALWPTSTGLWDALFLLQALRDAEPHPDLQELTVHIESWVLLRRLYGRPDYDVPVF